MKDLEVGKLFCIIQMGPKHNDIYPHKREGEGDFTHREEKKAGEAMGSVNMKADIGMMQPQAKECQQPPKNVRGRK